MPTASEKKELELLNELMGIQPTFEEKALDISKPIGGFGDAVASATSQVTNNSVARNPFGTGVGAAPSFNDRYYKAVIPNFLYKPPFGYPLFKDIPEIRRLSKSPYVTMITNTVCNEIAALDWNIVGRDGEKIPDEVIEKTRKWFYNPNRNEESLELVLRMLVRDILEIDAGVLVKVRNLKDEFVEMYVRDGGTFTKNPDVFGIMPEDRAYYQYGWLTGARPIPFNKNEVVYCILNPRADTIYGLSAVEVLLNVIQLLVYGVDSNLQYFSNNNIPKGVFKMIGANEEEIRAFTQLWDQHLKTKDEFGNWTRTYHRMPIINTEGEFESVGFSNADLQLIEQQKWFSKLVWACFNVTPSEMGFTEDSNKATEIMQGAVIKRKLIRPLVQLIEYHFNTQIINDLPWIKGTEYENKVLFDFDKFDLQEELSKRQIHWGDIEKGLRTVNEVREELDMEEIDGADDLRGAGLGMGMQFDTTQNFEEENPNKPQDRKEKEKEEREEQEESSKKKILKESNTTQKALITDSPVAPKEFEIVVEKQLELINKTIKQLIMMETGKKTVDEIKALDLSFIKQVLKVFDISHTASVIGKVVKDKYQEGMEQVEKKTDMNFMPNENALNFLQEYTFDNVKGMNDDLKNKLRQELERGIMNGEGAQALSKRVDKVMDVGKERAKMIARTESNRAENMGSLDAYKQSGLGGEKEWVAEIDSRTSPICRALNGKRVPVNEKFKYKGEEYDAPPSHVNCRSTIVFHPPKEAR